MGTDAHTFQDLPLEERLKLVLASADEESVQELLELDLLIESRPLSKFRKDNQAQMEFLRANSKIQAAFAGNQFGKTTALVVKALIQCCPSELLPKWMAELKTYEGPCYGRLLTISFTEGIEGLIIPAIKDWAPREALQGGSIDRAWKKAERMLYFENGSWIQMMSHDQDPAKFVGSRLHFVGYDEPPPKDIRSECLMRLVFHSGFEMFALTPLKANTTWIRREIYKKREHKDITVVRGSIHDNKLLKEADVERILSQYPDEERRAREFGDFVEIGGLIYPDFERSVVDPWVQNRPWTDTIISIDPGIRNAGIVWIGFDSDNTAYVYDELLLQDKTAQQYAEQIKAKNLRWLVKDPLYVIDPAARSRSQVNAETVETALQREGIYCNYGQNDVDAGILQTKQRIRYDRLKVSRNCRGLRDEADEYAYEDREDGVDKPIKGNDHRLDALRYGLMERPWDPIEEMEAPQQQLGWEANTNRLNPQPAEAPPMGVFS